VEGKDGLALIQLQAFDTEAVISAGAKNRPGRLTMASEGVDSKIHNTVNLTTDFGCGVLAMLDYNGKQRVNLSAIDASLGLGGDLGPINPVVNLTTTGGGNLTMLDGKGKQTVNLRAKDASLTMGGADTGGTVTVNGKDGQPNVQLLALDTEAVIGAGRKDRPGRLTMYDGNGNQAVNLSTKDASLTIGGPSKGRGVTVNGKDGQPDVQLLALDTEAVIGAGGSGNRPGRLTMYDGKGNQTVNLTAANGNISVTGDVTLSGSDCAEQFDMHDTISAEPGTIVVIDDEGRLRESQSAYDKRVAGVVSGAGEYRPGIVLDKQASSEGRASVALVGKVYCKADADPAPITVGDLLTTSVRPGFAMKATDSAHAFGAVIGKALRPLRAGQGMIPILVALQ